MPFRILQTAQGVSAEADTAPEAAALMREFNQKPSKAQKSTKPRTAKQQTEPTKSSSGGIAVLELPDDLSTTERRVVRAMQKPKGATNDQLGRIFDVETAKIGPPLAIFCRKFTNAGLCKPYELTNGDNGERRYVISD